jgi:zinc protease
MKKSIFILQLLVFAALTTVAQVDRSKRPDAGPAREPQIGSYDMFELKNGMKVFVVENSKLPRVSMSLIIDRDPLFEGEKAGYVTMAGDMMSRGTSNRSKEQLDEEVDFMGANLSSSATTVSASGLSKYTEKLVELMADVAMNPSMPQEEFDKAKEQFLSGIEAGKDDANSIMSNVYSALVYGKDHPYGEIITEETVQAITLEDCKQYHQTYFKPNVAYLAIVGDVKAKKMKKLLKKYFGDWEMGDVPTHTYELPGGSSETSVAFVDRQASVQSVIRIGNPIVLKPGDADIDAMRVMNQILGGGSSGRLYMNLREDKGFTYGAYSSYGTDELVSRFTASASVRNEVTDSAVQEFLFELKRISSGDISEDEIQRAKASISGSFGRSLEQPSTIAGFALSTARYNLPADYYQNYLKRLEAVTADDLKRVAEKYIATDNLIITIVGKGQEVAPSLEQFGAINYYDIYANPTEAPSFLTMPEGVTAEDVVNGYLEAIGGMEKLNALTAYDMSMEATMAGLPAPMNVRVAKKVPGYYMEVQEIPNMFKQKRLYAKGTAVSEGPQGNGPIEDEEQLAELKTMSTYVMSEMAYLTDAYTLELEGVNKLDGREVYQLKVTNAAGKVSREYYEVENGLKVREETEQETPNGPVTIATTIDAYEEIDGIVYPSLIIQDAGPQKINIKLIDVKTNKAVKTSIFQ